MENIIVVGSGWGAAGFLKNINAKNKNIIIISPNSSFIYTPLLAYSITKNIDLKNDITQINSNKVKHITGTVVSADLDNSILTLDSGEKVQYNNVIFSHGADINTFGIDGVNDNCYFVKTSHDTQILQNKLKTLEINSNIVVIGAGVTGVEIIGSLLDINMHKTQNIHIVDGIKRPINMFNESLSDYVISVWKENSININMNEFVKNLDKKNVYLQNKIIPYDVAIWCGGNKNSSLTNSINSYQNIKSSKGIYVNHNMSIGKYQNAYAIGDCSVSQQPFPKTAQVAYQQGKFLANNFNKGLNHTNNGFKYNHMGSIIHIGKGTSAFEMGTFHTGGKLVGYLNNVIHVYNAVSFNQRMKLSKSLFFQ